MFTAATSDKNDAYYMFLFLSILFLVYIAKISKTYPHTHTCASRKIAEK